MKNNISSNEEESPREFEWFFRAWHDPIIRTFVPLALMGLALMFIFFGNMNVMHPDN